ASSAQILFKSQLSKHKPGILGIVKMIFTNKLIIAGLMGYLGSLVVYLYALSKAPLSVVYPIFASSFIFVTLLSAKFLHEGLDYKRAIGIFAIFAGIVIIAISYA
ncbi:EamA family transporter, partial [Candidatus Marsarchaeota archaeon]|nr:EamA family transporter [Candidatus Marsarchaeota archaeon]